MAGDRGDGAGGDWPGWPSTQEHPYWPGAWKWGVDFAGATLGVRVLAVRLGDGDEKYGTDWIGPVVLTEETVPLLEAWAEDVLRLSGGYVHLFPADGDAADGLREHHRALHEDDEEGEEVVAEREA